MNNTGNSIPSNDLKDLSDNVVTFDNVVNSESEQTLTRTGKLVLTLAGWTGKFNAFISSITAQVNSILADVTAQADRAEEEADRAVGAVGQFETRLSNTETLSSDNQTAITELQAVTQLATVTTTGIVKLSRDLGQTNTDNTAASLSVVKEIYAGAMKLAYLYPDGTAENPGTIAINKRVVIDNPFPGSILICQAEILYNGQWGGTGWVYSTSGHGVLASQLNDDKIVVRSGGANIMSSSSNSGSPFENTGNAPSPSPYRVKVWAMKI